MGARLMGRRIVLTPGLPSKDLLERIVHHLRGGDAERRAAAFYLREFQERNEHELHGEPTVDTFADARLGITDREAQELIRIDRKLEDLSVLDEAFARGEIGWSKLRELTRKATRETEEEWLRFAKASTAREVERAIAAVKPGDPPPRDKKKLGTRRSRFKVSYELTARAKIDWETALEKLHSEFPRGTTTSEIFSHLAEMALRTPRFPAANGKTKRDPVHTIVYHAREDGKSWVEFNEGRAEIPLEDVLEVAERARVIRVDDPEKSAGETILFGKRGSVPEEDRAPEASEALRTAVSARESHRCAACRRRSPLMTHHVEARANGGKTRMSLLLALCERCHSLIHDGLLRLAVLEKGELELRNRKGELVAGDILAEGGVPQDLLTLIERVEVERRPAPADAGSEPAPPKAPAAADGASAPGETPPEEPAPTWGFSEVLTPPRSVSSEIAEIEDAGSVRDLPAAITAEGWQALAGRLRWSTSRSAFLYHGERECRRPGASGKKMETKEARGAAEHRPRTLSEVIGQGRVVSNLTRAVRAARERGEALPHTLLLGPAGTGKTSLAEALAREMEAGFRTVYGSPDLAPLDVLTLFSGMERGDALFIDEVHSLSPFAAESLHSALEDGVVGIPLADAEGPDATVVRLALEPFTLIAATTMPGKLPEPFRARFRIEETLDRYSLEDLGEIAGRAAGRLGLEGAAGALLEAARRSRRTPREAIRLVERSRDFAQARRSRRLERGDVIDAAGSLLIDAYGLREDERRILRFLIERGCAVGLETIAATLRLDTRTVKTVLEPYLLEEGLIVRTARGREATLKAREVLEKARSVEGEAVA